MKWLTRAAFCVMLGVMSAGCVQIGPKTIPAAECPKLKPPPPVEPKRCPQYNLPGIANTVTIKIRGSVVEADAGGEELIRNYARAQSLLR